MPEQFSWVEGQYLGFKILFIYIYISNKGERNERGTICYKKKKNTDKKPLI